MGSVLLNLFSFLCCVFVLCSVFLLCLVCLILPVSLEYPFLIVTSILSNVYVSKYEMSKWVSMINPKHGTTSALLILIRIIEL